MKDRYNSRRIRGAVNVTTVSTRREDKCARTLEFPFSVMGGESAAN